MSDNREGVTIAFPTMGRCSSVRTWEHVPVTTWAAVEPREYGVYHKNYPQYAFRVLPADYLNISSKRQWILEQAMAAHHRWLFMLEDDLEGFFLRQGKTPGGSHKLIKASWKDILQPMINCAEQLQLTELGLSQQQSNHWYEEETVQYACKTTEFCLFDLARLEALHIEYDTNLTHFEDFDITLNVLLHGGRTALYLLAAFGHVTMGVNPGGHQSPGTDRKKDTIDSIDYLVKKYPGYVQLKQGRLFPEPKIAWAALRKGMPGMVSKE